MMAMMGNFLQVVTQLLPKPAAPAPPVPALPAPAPYTNQQYMAGPSTAYTYQAPNAGGE